MQQGVALSEVVRTYTLLVPPIHISDNLRLKPREYVFSLRGLEIGRWQTEANCLLAVSQDPQARPLPGKETREPAFGANARSIHPGLEDQGIAAGYSVVDQVTVISPPSGWMRSTTRTPPARWPTGWAWPGAVRTGSPTL